jgi:RimJ/RimL family protein N-acetyltransferase
MTQLPSRSALTVRRAGPNEAEIVRRLDTVVFPSHSLDLQRADEGELEDATKVEDVFVLELRGEVSAYIHLDRQDSRWLYIAGIGVLPHKQNQGLGTFMLRAVLEECQQQVADECGTVLPVYTVTSPRNTRMLRVLFNLGFAGRWALPNHFGSGRHRIGCQMLLPGNALDASRTRTARVGGIDHLDRLLAERWVIRRQFKDSAGRFFELAESVAARDFLPCPRPESPAHEKMSSLTFLAQ